MDGAAQAASGADDEALLGGGSSPDFAFLPQNLSGQCRSLIESYHGLHGYGCLPDILWKAGLGPFIETHREFRPLLRKASTTRSSKKSNDGFAQIATTLLSLEILASNFAGWSALYPHAAATARSILNKSILDRSILKRHTRISHAPLMESYLYPPKHISQAAIAALATPTRHEPAEAIAFSRPTPDAAGRQVSDVPPMAASPLPT